MVREQKECYAYFVGYAEVPGDPLEIMESGGSLERAETMCRIFRDLGKDAKIYRGEWTQSEVKNFCEIPLDVRTVNA
jgi:hypothetical protein